MKPKVRFYKRCFAFMLSLMLVVSTVNVNILTAEAAKEASGDLTTLPVGLEASYLQEEGAIRVVWGQEGVYDTYCVTITGKDTTESYSKEYPSQTIGEQRYSDTYEAGKTYTVEVQGEQNQGGY